MIKVMAPRVFPICLYREAICLQYLPLMCNVMGVATHTHTHTRVTTFTRFAQNCVSACIVCLYYACSYTVAFSPGVIPSFVLLHTEKLAFQCTTLLSWE